MRFLRRADLGFDKEQVVVVNIFRSNLVGPYDEFKHRLLLNNNVLHVTTSEEILGSKYQTYPLKPEGSTEYQQFQRLMVGYDFVEAFDLEILAGRSFNKKYARDDSLAVLINEAMVRHLNWGSPENALGKGFTGGRRTQVVIGVLKDFHYAPLHNPIGPFMLDVADTETQHDFFDRYLAVRIAPANYQGTIQFLQQTWSEFLPNRPFEYFFLDDELDKLYRAEENLGKIAGTFSAFAIFVASIGLLGIASFAAEARTKEVGIRKTLGASAMSIFMELSKSFMTLVAMATLLAWPIAYLLISRWQAEFAYRVEIGFLPFLLSGILALLIAWGTVSYQAIRAALANPVEALRYE